MRITNGTLTQTFLYNLNQIEVGMSQSQNEISTGRSLNKPSDSPLDISQDLATRSAITQAQASQTTISQGLTWMQTTNTALQNFTSTLQSIRGVVLQGINGANQDANSISGMKISVQQMEDNLNQILDTQQGNSYIFGGFLTDTAPSSYLQSGSTVAYSASNAQGAIQYAVSASVSMQVNVTGYQLMQQVPAGGTRNLADTLAAIVSDMGNPTNLQTDLQDLDANISQATNATTQLGARIQEMNTMQAQNSQFITLLNNQKASLENANMAQVMTQFTNQQVTYQAALKVGSELLLPSLTQYL